MSVNKWGVHLEEFNASVAEKKQEMEKLFDPNAELKLLKVF